MAFYEWKDSLSVNVGEIDNQHKKLIGMISGLFDAMSSGKGNDVLGKILTELVEYTRMHFAAEERFMKQYNYPLESKHKTEHQILTNEVMKLQTDFMQGRAAMTIVVMNFLKDWLNNHIMQNDKRFGEYLNSQGKR